MRWERLQNARLREAPDGKKSPGRKGGIFGPGNRWGHTCNSIRGGKLVYVFGGYGQDNCQTNDVFVFDTARQTWSKPMVKGNPPSPRDSHSCTTVGNNLFVFGGTDGRDPLKDLHILDTGSNTWISPSFRGEGPEAREGHSAALVGKRLFIFGGCGKSQESSNDSSNEVYFNDIYILDTETLVWRRAMTSGKQPSPRDSHSCSSWKNKLIVVAGEDASDYYLSDVHVLDTDTLVWKQLMTLGQKLPPRAGHSTVALGKNLFVFGGFTDERNLYDDLHMLNLETGVWTKVTATGQGPSARFSVAGDCLDTRKGVLVFIGGCNKDLEALDDMFYLHTDIMMENGQDEPRHEKLSLRKELKRKCQEEQQLSSSLPANNSIVHNVGTLPEVRQIPVLTACEQTDVKSSTLHEMRPTQEHIFEAKVTEAFHYGYTIETNINGKPLRGIVFSYKPGFAPSANSYLSRNIMVDGIGDDNKLNGSHKSKSEISALTQWDAEDHIQKDAKESTSHESPVETTTAPASNNSTVADVSLLHTASVNSETSPLPPPKDHRPDQPNGDISKEMLTSPRTQVTDETTSSIKEA